MPQTWDGVSVQLLTDAPIPALIPEQLAKFTAESIHLSKVQDFDVADTVTRIGMSEDKLVIAADFGGDKGVIRRFEVQAGKLKVVSGYVDDIQGNDGIGYAAKIEKAAMYAQIQALPMGLSWGGPLDGTKMLFHPKAKVFFDEMTSRFGADFDLISPSLKGIMNDAPAGVMSGAVEAYRQYGAKTVLFIINGGGIGLAILKDGAIWATEAGHVEAVQDLNVYGQNEPCGVFDTQYVCVERLGANKAGIETQWQTKTGSYMRARDIEDEYKKGDAFAAEIYEHSVQIIAHTLAGTAQAMEIDLASHDTVIVAHGGAFKFPAYGERVQQILQQGNQTPVRLLMTKDYVDENSNACLDGAAIAALITN